LLLVIIQQGAVTTQTCGNPHKHKNLTEKRIQ